MPGTSIRGRCGWAWLTSTRSATIAVGVAITRLTHRHQRQQPLGERAAEQQSDRRSEAGDYAINVHLPPNKSPSLPPSNSRLPNASAHAVIAHWRLSVEKCSAR
jgi:hypothetical protein